jgi:hypothetical protein
MEGIKKDGDGSEVDGGERQGRDTEEEMVGKGKGKATEKGTEGDENTLTQNNFLLINFF